MYAVIRHHLSGIHLVDLGRAPPPEIAAQAERLGLIPFYGIRGIQWRCHGPADSRHLATRGIRPGEGIYSDPSWVLIPASGLVEVTPASPAAAATWGL